MMMDLLNSGINTRFDITLNSSSDKEFYLNLHQYFDYIYKTKALLNILNTSEKDYHSDFRKIWGEYRKYSEEELDEKSAQVSKLERFNMYAIGATIIMRIYTPIEEYKTTPEQDAYQDPVAVILIKGYDYALKLNRWDKNVLKSYNNWFVGQRGMYEAQLRRFHLAMLDGLAKPLPLIKPVLIFDTEQSVIKIDNKEIRITLKNDKPNAHYVLEHIFDNEEGLSAKFYYTDIIESKFPKEKMDWRSVHRASIDINKKISEQAELSNFLIIKTGISGYIQVNPDFL